MVILFFLLSFTEIPLRIETLGSARHFLLFSFGLIKKGLENAGENKCILT